MKKRINKSELIRQALQEGKSVAEIAKKFKIKPQTVYTMRWKLNKAAPKIAVKRKLPMAVDKIEVLTHEQANKVYQSILKRSGNTRADDQQYGGAHYKELGVQPWKAMEAWMSQEAFAGFLRGNAIKYLARTDKKGGVEDLKKARHYLDKLIEVLEDA
jgi:transposase-like protein